MADNGTCKKCGGAIDDQMVAAKRRMHARKGTEYTPPKICSDCLWLALNELMNEDDEN